MKMATLASFMKKTLAQRNLIEEESHFSNECENELQDDNSNISKVNKTTVAIVKMIALIYRIIQVEVNSSDDSDDDEVDLGI